MAVSLLISLSRPGAGSHFPWKLRRTGRTREWMHQGQIFSDSLDGASAVMQHARPSLFADVAASDRSLDDCSGSDSRLELGL